MVGRAFKPKRRGVWLIAREGRRERSLDEIGVSVKVRAFEVVSKATEPLSAPGTVLLGAVAISVTSAPDPGYELLSVASPYMKEILGQNIRGV